VHWRKPRTIFVSPLGDLFHEAVPDEFILDVWTVMARCAKPWRVRYDQTKANTYGPHRFIVLTKRAERMHEVLGDFKFGWQVTEATGQSYPLPNVLAMTTVEKQDMADERIAHLLATPAVLRGVSTEPLLGPVDLGLGRWVRLPREVRGDAPFADHIVALAGMHKADVNSYGAVSVVASDGQLLGVKPGEFEPAPTLDWVVLGGETGLGARPMHPDWARSVRDQCAKADIPFFLKAWGEWLPALETSATDWAPIKRAQALSRIHIWDEEEVSLRVGRKAAGHLLDGREHREYPEWTDA
jgi:protein gp37